MLPETLDVVVIGAGPAGVIAALRAARLGARAAGVFPQAVMHVPIETARAARREAETLQADCAVVVGGGSTTGLGKAIALAYVRTDLATPGTALEVEVLGRRAGARVEAEPLYDPTNARLRG